MPILNTFKGRMNVLMGLKQKDCVIQIKTKCNILVGRSVHGFMGSTVWGMLELLDRLFDEPEERELHHLL